MTPKTTCKQKKPPDEDELKNFEYLWQQVQLRSKFTWRFQKFGQPGQFDTVDIDFSDLQDSDIVNIDEQGLSNAACVQKRQVFIAADAEVPYEREERLYDRTTIINAIAYDGSLVPPMLIKRGSELFHEQFPKAWPSVQVACTSSGYIDTELWTQVPRLLLHPYLLIASDCRLSPMWPQTCDPLGKTTTDLKGSDLSCCWSTTTAPGVADVIFAHLRRLL